MLQDEITEGALLGAILATPAKWHEASDLWALDMFTTSQNRIVARLLEACVKAKRPLDAYLIASQAQELGVDANYVFDLAASADLAQLVRPYAEHLRELQGKRKYQAICRKGSESSTGVLQEQIGRTQADLKALEAETIGARAGVMGEAVHNRVMALEDERDGRTENTSVRFMSGFRELDRVTGGFTAGTLVVIGALPGQGKSSVAVALIDSFVKQGAVVGAFWLEDSVDDFADRIIMRRAGITSMALRSGKNIPKEDLKGIAAQIQDFSESRSVIDDTHGLTMPQVAARMRIMAREHGVNVFILDHLGEIKVERGEWKDRHDLAYAAVAREFRDVAKELNAVPILFAQLNRDQEKREDPTTLKSDFAGSYELARMARVMVGIRKDDEEKRLRFDIIKNTKGIEGTINVGWRAETMTVTDL